MMFDKNANSIPAIHSAIEKGRVISKQLDQIITNLKAALQAPIAELDCEENRCPNLACRALLGPSDMDGDPIIKFREWVEVPFICGACGYKGIMHYDMVFSGYTDERGNLI